jgi:XRE family transcriptional regulator, aerobic/anaerobic benzoate catabolism transcriptional regulator
MPKIHTPLSDMRRGSAPAAEAYLRAVGERVRHERQRLGMSRRALAETSGVSERYLAELERGAGNASLLVLRKVAQALSLRVEDLASEPSYDERSIAAE